MSIRDRPKDGARVLQIYEMHPETCGDNWVLPENAEARPFTVTEFAEGSPQVSPDGQHFLMIQGGEEEGGNRLNVVLNWSGELKRLAA